jgi:glycerol-3-phosphate dehydrogenase
VAWSSPGLVAIAGGKLTTFRAIALDALRLVKPQLTGWDDPLDAWPVFAPVPLPAAPVAVDAGMLRRLHGRYGACAAALIDAARPGELERIPGTKTAWAELRWAARSEAVLHLDDLLLRRTRLGLLLRDGGAAHLDRIRAICQPELGWDDVHWAQEETAYRTHWTLHHGLPHDD